jgi:hypothetical protein
VSANRNRFNGFSDPHETVETVSAAAGPSITLLKRGVNDTTTTVACPIPRTQPQGPSTLTK